MKNYRVNVNFNVTVEIEAEDEMNAFMLSCDEISDMNLFDEADIEWGVEEIPPEEVEAERKAAEEIASWIDL